MRRDVESVGVGENEDGNGHEGMQTEEQLPLAMPVETSPGVVARAAPTRHTAVPRTITIPASGKVPAKTLTIPFHPPKPSTPAEQAKYDEDKKKLEYIVTHPHWKYICDQPYTHYPNGVPPRSCYSPIPKDKWRRDLEGEDVVENVGEGPEMPLPSEPEIKARDVDKDKEKKRMAEMRKFLNIFHRKKGIPQFKVHGAKKRNLDNEDADGQTTVDTAATPETFSADPTENGHEKDDESGANFQKRGNAADSLRAAGNIINGPKEPNPPAPATPGKPAPNMDAIRKLMGGILGKDSSDGGHTGGSAPPRAPGPANHGLTGLMGAIRGAKQKQKHKHPKRDVDGVEHGAIVDVDVDENEIEDADGELEANQRLQERGEAQLKPGVNPSTVYAADLAAFMRSKNWKQLASAPPGSIRKEFLALLDMAAQKQRHSKRGVDEVVDGGVGAADGDEGEEDFDLDDLWSAGFAGENLSGIDGLEE